MATASVVWVTLSFKLSILSYINDRCTRCKIADWQHVELKWYYTVFLNKGIIMLGISLFGLCTLAKHYI